MKKGPEKRFMGLHGKRRGESSRLHQPSEGSQRLSEDDALAYLKAVEETFKDNRDKYVEFLKVMQAFKAQRLDAAGVTARVRDLFKGHHSLILDFYSFLPEGCEIKIPSEELPTRKQLFEFNQAVNYVTKIKTRFQNHDLVYKTHLEILNMYRKGNISIDEAYHEVETLFYDHPDLLEELTYFLPDCTCPTPSPIVPTSARLSSRRISGVTCIRHSHKENMLKKEKPVTSQNNFCQSTIVKDERTSMEAENEHWNKVEKQNDRKEDRERKEKDKGEKRSAQSRDRELDVLYSLLHKRKCTRSDESVPNHTQTGQVGGCAAKQSLENTAIEDSNSLIADVNSGEGGCVKLVKMENGREKDRDYDREMEMENERIKAENQERQRERDKDRHHRAKDILNSNACLLPNKEKFMNKPISDLDLSNCERCTPSYRLLPKSHTKSVASYCTDLAAEVLNDSWVSVTSGREDYFKHPCKNQYEEILFRCEDDRFEMDMLIESTAATTERVEELLKKMQDNTIKRDGPIQMEDHLTAINLRCIERIYGDHGFEVLDLLRKDPAVALPVILNRLQQKQDEWSRCRVDMNKVWAEVYAKNYHKSLDHRDSELLFQAEGQKKFESQRR